MAGHTCYNCALYRDGYCATPMMLPQEIDLATENECLDWVEYKPKQKLWENVSLDTIQ